MIQSQTNRLNVMINAGRLCQYLSDFDIPVDVIQYNDDSHFVIILSSTHCIMVNAYLYVYELYDEVDDTLKRTAYTSPEHAALRAKQETFGA